MLQISPCYSTFFLRLNTLSTAESGLKRDKGMPQGSPLSPLLSNILLDDLDKELERRGHRFCRYADDCNIYVSSQKAGDHLLTDISKFLSEELK